MILKYRIELEAEVEISEETLRHWDLEGASPREIVEALNDSDSHELAPELLRIRENGLPDFGEDYECIDSGWSED